MKLKDTKKVLIESGIRGIKDLSNRYKKAKIYFHQDLDGVTTALGMKHYLENNGIKVVDAEIIQYGDKEFAVKKPDASGEIMPVLVDFAHGKPMFVIHTDHHLEQVGVEKGTATQFRGAKSNVETISQIVSPKEIFPPEDVELISTVDSASFTKHDISVDEVINYLFKLDKDQSFKRNKMMLGLVTNKLLLAFKNKPGFLETIVLNAKPSLLSILSVIKGMMKERGLATPEELQANKEKYISTMETYPGMKYEDGIIIQYGGGSMIKPGSYDRYTPFKNNPEADFLVMAWPMGLVQVSCNPFKHHRELKGVHLGELAQEVLATWESQLKSRIIPLSTIKWISETSAKDDSVGFTFKDLMGLFSKNLENIDDRETIISEVETIMNKPFTSLTDEELNILDSIGVNAWTIIQSMSGGHFCISNISGLNYLGRGKRPPQKTTRKKNDEDDDAPYVKFTKMIQNALVNKLKEKIEESN
jgi:hypothetical protein